MEADEVKQEIIRLYYEEHKRPSEIAPIIEKTPQYVSKIVTKDKRYKNEKKYKQIYIDIVSIKCSNNIFCLCKKL